MATSLAPRRLQQRIGERSGNSFGSMACRWTESASQSAKSVLGQQDDGRGQSGMDRSEIWNRPRRRTRPRCIGIP
jgi:hypothetical protein